MAGYDKIIFDDEEAIAACRKYRENEVICTYHSLQSSMSEYHMAVAIKKGIDEIERSESPCRDDEYGTAFRTSK